jgi:HD-like signal output (HDOD) protein
VESPEAVDLEPLVRGIIARGAIKVPPYPGVVMKLNQLVQGGKYGTSDLVKVVGADPVITAALLRYANSAMHRGAATVTALPDALARLGSEEVLRIAMATSLGGESAKAGPLAKLRRKTWEESLTSAICCMHLALARSLDPKEAFVCGLLHDFGRLVAIGCLESILVERKDVRTMSGAEWLIFVDRFHVELGSLTAAKWNLTPVVQTVIANHHKPAVPGAFRAMLDVVIASDAIVRLLDAQPSVNNGDLKGLSCLNPVEIDVMLKVVPQIPGFLAGLADATPETARGVAMASQVTKAPSILESQAKTVDIPAKLVRTKGDLALRISAMGRTGLAFVGPEKLAENFLCKVKLDLDGGPLEVWAHVTRATPAGTGFEMEGKLFALNGPAKERWHGFLDANRVVGGTTASTAIA